MSKFVWVPFVALTLTTWSTMVDADMLVLTPSQDNTMYAESGTLSNGAGFYFFAGTNSAPNARRGLVAFDLTAIPPNSTITNVSLDLVASTPKLRTFTVSLHRLLEAWGEGTSVGTGGGGGEGGGDQAHANDATWSHAFWNGTMWGTPGGVFSAASASLSVGNPATYTWSSAQMVADVQDWVSNPSSNYGWIVIGDETAMESAMRFDSRNNQTMSDWPQLTVEFDPVSNAESSVGQMKQNFDARQNQ